MSARELIVLSLIIAGMLFIAWCAVFPNVKRNWVEDDEPDSQMDDQEDDETLSGDDLPYEWDSPPE